MKIRPDDRPYLRDGRAPIPRHEATSRAMRANKARDTRPELALRHALTLQGATGFTLHQPNLPGRPDVAFPKDRLAVFVHGCFWHRCPMCKPRLPKSHQRFWAAKFESNRLRDERKRRLLRRFGWSVMTLRECRIHVSTAKAAGRVLGRLERIRSRKAVAETAARRSEPLKQPLAAR